MTKDLLPRHLGNHLLGWAITSIHSSTRRDSGTSQISKMRRCLSVQVLGVPQLPTNYFNLQASLTLLTTLLVLPDQRFHSLEGLALLFKDKPRKRLVVNLKPRRPLRRKRRKQSSWLCRTGPQRGWRRRKARMLISLLSSDEARHSRRSRSNQWLAVPGAIRGDGVVGRRLSGLSTSPSHRRRSPGGRSFLTAERKMMGNR